MLTNVFRSTVVNTAAVLSVLANVCRTMENSNVASSFSVRVEAKLALLCIDAGQCLQDDGGRFRVAVISVCKSWSMSVSYTHLTLPTNIAV